MKPEELYQELKKYNFGPFMGVADSSFGGFFNYLDTLKNEYIPDVNEGLAFSRGAGSYLTGKKPVVMMQNAGIGNLINPQTSLNNLYNTKSLLLVGWRGNPANKKDAPEHWYMGENTKEFLELANIKSKVLESFDDIKWANDELENTSTVALIVNPEFIEKYESQHKTNYEMSRYDAVELIANNTKDMIRISTTGMISRELNKADDAPKNFYVIGSMGHASSIGLGIAKEVKEKIIVLDGDGAALMHLGVLSTIGNIKPKNFLHICLDNESWSSTGGQRTTSNTTEIKDIALACGYTNSRKVNDKENLEKVIKELLELDGPNFLLVNVKKGNLEDIERIELLPEEITKRFMEAIK